VAFWGANLKMPQKAAVLPLSYAPVVLIIRYSTGKGLCAVRRSTPISLLWDLIPLFFFHILFYFFASSSDPAVLSLALPAGPCHEKASAATRSRGRLRFHS